MKNRCGFCKAWCSFLFLVIIHTLNSLWFPSILSRFWSGMVLVNIIWSPFHQAVPPAKLTISHSKPAKFNVATRNSAQLFVLKCFHPTKKMHFVNFVAFSHIFYEFPNYISSWQTAIWIRLWEKTVPKVRSETSCSFATLRWWSGASCEGSRGPGSATYLERTCCSYCVWCSMLGLFMHVFFMHIIDYQIGLYWIVIVLFFLIPVIVNTVEDERYHLQNEWWLWWCLGSLLLSTGTTQIK